MRVVVDTNVAIVANGRETHASLSCQVACIEFLEELLQPNKRSHIILDELGLIMDEYSEHLNYRGQPGVGDIFFKYLHDHMWLGKKVLCVPITPITDEHRSFNELPENSVDISDRKFLATAVAADAEIANAVDTDWHQQSEFIEGLEVNVLQLCPSHGCI